MFEPCPCGSGKTLLACCGRLLSGQAAADTPESLMRSRYTAYVRGDAAYVLNTWARATRPAALDLSDGREWLGLTVEAAPTPDAGVGTVRFTARYRLRGETRKLSETSRFAREDGRWVYVDGDVT